MDALQDFAEVFSDYVRRMPDHYLDFLLLRRRMRDRDIRPFFDGEPGAV